MPTHAVRLLLRCQSPSELPPPDLPEVSLLGRSNVGKSTLLNRLIGRRGGVARTSKKPGCTRSMNLFLVDERFILVDLPGYGYAKTARSRRLSWERELIPGYLESRRSLRGSILLVDSRHPGKQLDEEMAAFLRELGKPYVIALTKIDKTRRRDRKASVAEASRIGPVTAVSAVTGEGIPALWKWIHQVIA